MKNKVVKDVYFNPIQRLVEKANVGLTVVQGNGIVSKGLLPKGTIILAITTEPKEAITNDGFCNYETNSIFVEYVEYYSELAISYRHEGAFNLKMLEADVDQVKDTTASLYKVLHELERAVNKVFGI